jgi:hypothetical protein
MKTLGIVLLPLVLAGCLRGQSYYRADSNPIIRWGRQDTDKIVEHYVSSAGRPAIKTTAGIPLVFYAGVGQTSNVTEWRDSNDNLHAYVYPLGATGTRKLEILDQSPIIAANLFWDVQATVQPGARALWIRDSAGSEVLRMNTFTSSLADLWAEYKGDWRPQADATYNLGSSTKAWKDFYAGTARLGNAAPSLTFLDSTDASSVHFSWDAHILTVGTSLGASPLTWDGDNTTWAFRGTVRAQTSSSDLGTSAVRWNKLWVTDIDCAGSCGTLPVADTTAVVKGSADATKLMRFEVDGLSPSTTRVLTPQDADYILAGKNIDNSFSAFQTFKSTIAGEVLSVYENNHTQGYSGTAFRDSSGNVKGRLAWANEYAVNNPSTLHFGTTSDDVVGLIQNGVERFRLGTDDSVQVRSDIPDFWLYDTTSADATKLKWDAGVFAVNIAGTDRLTWDDANLQWRPRGHMIPASSGWELGSSAVRWNKLWVTDLDCSGTGCGATYPLNHVAPDGGDTDHLLATNSANITLAIMAHSNDGVGDRAGLTLGRTRGTQSSPSSVAAGDRLGSIAAMGFVNADYRNAALIQVYADAVSVPASYIAGRMEFFTTNNSGTTASRWTLQSNGHLAPTFDNSYTLGDSTHRPSTTYARNLDVNGTVTGSLSPASHEGYDLGVSGTNHWRFIYARYLTLTNGLSLTGDVTGTHNLVTTTNTQTIPATKTFSSIYTYFTPWTGGFSALMLGPSGNQVEISTTGTGQLSLLANTKVLVTGDLQMSYGNLIAKSGTTGTDFTATCGAGQAIKSLTVSGGIVTAASCGTP